MAIGYDKIMKGQNKADRRKVTYP